MSNNETKRILIKKVRLSFPSVFEKEMFEGKETKYSTTLLIPKSNEKIKRVLDKAIEDLLKENKIKKLSADKICLKDGDETDYDSNQDRWTLKAANNKKPKVYDRYGNKIEEDDDQEVIYPGVIADVSIDFWFQNNKYGKRVNANLHAIKSYGEGESFGSGGGSVGDEVKDDFDFEDMDETLLEDDEDEIGF